MKSFEECSWCCEKSLKVDRAGFQAENQLRLLLSLLNLSPSVVIDQGTFHLCATCNYLTEAGIDYKRRFDEVKSTLRKRVITTKSKTRKTVKDASPVTLGHRIAKCFLNCNVELERVHLDEVTSEKDVKVLGEIAQAAEPESFVPGEIVPESQLIIAVKHEEDPDEAAILGDDVKSTVSSSVGVVIITPEVVENVACIEEPAVNVAGDPIIKTQVDIGEHEWMEIDDAELLEPEEITSEEVLHDRRILPEEENRELADEIEELNEMTNLDQHKLCEAIDINTLPVTSDDDFSVQEVCLSDESSDDNDDPSFASRRTEVPPDGITKQPTKRLTRSSARNSEVTAVSWEVQLHTDKSSTTRMPIIRGKASPKKVEKASPQKQKLTQSSGSTPSGNVHEKVPRESLLDATTVTRDQCLFCTTSVPETSDHLFSVHNLVRQFGNYYSCRFCLQAYFAPDPETRTGLLTADHFDHFREFVKLHESCLDQLQQAKEPQRCKVCGKEFYSGPECISHEYKNHGDDTPKASGQVMCAACPGKKYSLNHLNHMKNVHPRPKWRYVRLYGCCDCPARFRFREEFRLHNSHHAFSAFSSSNLCVLCDSPRESVVSLYGHYNSTHGLDFINFSHFACVNCNQAFQSTSEVLLPSGTAPASNRSELEVFVQAHAACTMENLGSVEQHCRFCWFTTSKAKLLIEHEQCMHQEDMPADTTKRCKVCGLPCDDLQLVEHLFRHSPEDVDIFKRATTLPNSCQQSNIVNCRHCGAKFAARNHLYTAHHNMHVIDERSRARDSGLGLQLFGLPRTDCILCEFNYFLKDNNGMKDHYQKQHNLNLIPLDLQFYFNCKSCSTPFQSNNSDQPLGLVTPEDVETFRSYASEHYNCSRDVSTNYSCRQCSRKKFETLHDLVIHHVEKHLALLKCEYCSASFNSHTHFRKHIRRYHSQKYLIEVKCHRCWRKFDTLEELKEHLKEGNVGVTEKHLLPTAGFTCLSCNLFFDSTALLVLHIQEIHDRSQDLTFNCQQCTKVLKSNDFRSPRRRSGSQKRSHGPYILDTEGEERNFETFTALCIQHHQECVTQNSSELCTVDLDSDFCCHICKDTSSASSQDFSAHLNRHVGFEIAVKCPLCTHISSSEKAQRVHISEDHNLEIPMRNFYHCNTCKEHWISTTPNCCQTELPSAEVMDLLLFAERHATCEKEQRTMFACGICKLETAVPQKLRSHVMSEHHEKYPPLCVKCGQDAFLGAEVGNTSRAYKIKGRKRQRNFPCPHCGKMFFSRVYMERHFRRVHKGIPLPNQEVSKVKEGPHLCPQCGKIFKKATLLRFHMNTHSGDRPYKCDQCDKAYCAPRLLYTHKKVHKDARFLCPECGKVYRNAPALQLHMNSHTGDRPYKCTQCDKAFGKPLNLTLHKKTHQENRERNLPCPHCDKMFFRRQNVTQHIRVFHNKLPWPSKIKSYRKWIPKNPEALAAAGIEYHRKSMTEESDSD